MLFYVENYVKMMEAVFTEPLLAVSNNGYWSDFQEITCGVCQVCCYSAGVFIILVELLGLGIRQNNDIEGISIGNTEIKAGQFADDLWSTLKAKSANVNNILREMEWFGRFTGLRINPDKTLVPKLGPFRNSDVKFYTLKQLYWSPGADKVLGIKLHPDKTGFFAENFEESLKKAQAIFEKWSNHILSLQGKIVVINILTVCSCISVFALPTPPENFFHTYRKMVIEFLWEGKVPKIAYNKLIQRHESLV